LRARPGEEGADDAGKPLSTGEWAKFTSVIEPEWMGNPFEWVFWASIAGEVSGLKYSPGMVYSGCLN
jgi:hypothetical protein